MRISDLSSDVCSSDLLAHGRTRTGCLRRTRPALPARWRRTFRTPAGHRRNTHRPPARHHHREDTVAVQTDFATTTSQRDDVGTDRGPRNRLNSLPAPLPDQKKAHVWDPRNWRSEERSEGKGCVSTCRYRRAPETEKKKKQLP